MHHFFYAITCRLVQGLVIIVLASFIVACFPLSILLSPIRRHSLVSISNYSLSLEASSFVLIRPPFDFETLDFLKKRTHGAIRVAMPSFFACAIRNVEGRQVHGERVALSEAKFWKAAWPLIRKKLRNRNNVFLIFCLCVSYRKPLSANNGSPAEWSLNRATSRGFPSKGTFLKDHPTQLKEFKSKHIDKLQSFKYGSICYQIER